MKEEFVHVFRRNVDTINVTLEHIMSDGPISKEIIKGHFECIRMAIDHCEELALEEDK